MPDYREVRGAIVGSGTSFVLFLCLETFLWEKIGKTLTDGQDTKSQTKDEFGQTNSTDHDSSNRIHMDTFHSLSAITKERNNFLSTGWL